MATVQRYVNTGSTAGGDGTTNATSGASRAYASLSEWEAAEQTNLVTDGDNHIVDCDGSGGSDATMLDLDGWTTDATHTITIQATGAQKTNGVSRDNDGTGYQIAVSTDDALRNREDYVLFSGIEAKGPCSGTPVYRQTVVSASNDVQFDSCLFVTDSAGSSTRIIGASLSNLNLTMTNCLAVGKARAIDTRNAASAVLDHCGFFGDRDYGLTGDSELTCTNTWIMGFTTQCFWTGGAAPSGSNNASSDGSADTDYDPDLGSLTDTDEFTSPSLTLSSFDFSLKAASNLVDAGTGSESLDMAGDSRDASPDIGPFEYIAAGGGTLHSLVPDDVVQLQNVDATSIVMDHLISPSDVVQVQTGGATTIVLSHSFSPADVSQSQQGDASNLVLQHMLGPADVNQLQAGDAGNLILAHLISPSDVNQVQPTDSSDLQLDGVISPADVNQIQSVDGAALTVAHVISPADVAQIQNADGSTLIITNALSPDDVSQLQSAIEASVVLSHGIVPDDVIQNQAADSSAILSAFILSPEDVEQIQTASFAFSLPPGALVLIGNVTEQIKLANGTLVNVIKNSTNRYKVH